jgi:hypothetical protein
MTLIYALTYRWKKIFSFVNSYYFFPYSFHLILILQMCRKVILHFRNFNWRFDTWNSLSYFQIFWIDSILRHFSLKRFFMLKLIFKNNDFGTIIRSWTSQFFSIIINRKFFFIILNYSNIIILCFLFVFFDLFDAGQRNRSQIQRYLGGGARTHRLWILVSNQNFGKWTLLSFGDVY